MIQTWRLLVVAGAASVALMGGVPPVAAGTGSTAPVTSSAPASVAARCAAVLPAATHGRAAVTALGSRLSGVAAGGSLPPDTLRERLLHDSTLWVDSCGQLFYVDPAVSTNAMHPASSQNAGTPPLALAANVFALHSSPGSHRVIYLDFNGESISGTGWNTTFNNGDAIVAPPYDTDDSPATFSADEQAAVQAIWQQVSEDYAPFDVDVTTQNPGLAAIDRTNSADGFYGTRALITNDTLVMDQCACGGVAYLGVFDMVGSHQSTQPAWVFAGNLAAGDPKSVAEAVSHEVGHNFGLLHDGTNAVGYYSGRGIWAPIMGVGYYKPLVQWSRGEYSNANNTEDDLAIIPTHGAAVRPDDYANSRAGAASLGSGSTLSASGLISTHSDVDWFRFGGSGATTVTVTPAAEISPDLDARIDLYDSNGSLVAWADAPSSAISQEVAAGLSASISVSLVAGTYTVKVDGVGSGDPLTTGYSDYASLGRYTLTVTTTPSAGGPSNDTPADAVVVQSFPFAAGLDTTGATDDPGFAWSCSADQASVWYELVAPARGALAVVVNSPDFDPPWASSATPAPASPRCDARTRTRATRRAWTSLSLRAGPTGWRLAAESGARAGLISESPSTPTAHHRASPALPRPLDGCHRRSDRARPCSVGPQPTGPGWAFPHTTCNRASAVAAGRAC